MVFRTAGLESKCNSVFLLGKLCFSLKRSMILLQIIPQLLPKSKPLLPRAFWQSGAHRVLEGTVVRGGFDFFRLALVRSAGSLRKDTQCKTKSKWFKITANHRT